MHYLIYQDFRQTDLIWRRYITHGNFSISMAKLVYDLKKKISGANLVYDCKRKSVGQN
jgi:hypothetical protein